MPDLRAIRRAAHTLQSHAGGRHQNSVSSPYRWLADTFSGAPRRPSASLRSLAGLRVLAIARMAAFRRCSCSHRQSFTSSQGRLVVPRSMVMAVPEFADGAPAPECPPTLGGQSRFTLARPARRLRSLDVSHLSHITSTTAAHQGHNNPIEAVSHRPSCHGVFVVSLRRRNNPLTLLSINGTLSAP